VVDGGSSLGSIAKDCWVFPLIEKGLSTSLWFDDRLDGASNFLSWKVRVTLLLEENDL
jgi:hypothetical protein